MICPLQYINILKFIHCIIIARVHKTFYKNDKKFATENKTPKKKIKNKKQNKSLFLIKIKM